MINKSRYIIKNWDVIDTQAGVDGDAIYIREIVDWGCTESQNSTKSIQERHAIIEAIGLRKLIDVLQKCYVESGKSYPADKVAVLTYLIYCDALGLECIDPYARREEWHYLSKQIDIVKKAPVLIRAIK